MYNRFRGHKGLAVAGIISLLLAGCATLATMKLTAPDTGIKFPHPLHEAMACTDCHGISGATASMPTHDNCSTCHEIDMDNPTEEACGFCHTNTDFTITRQKVLSDEIQFTHEAHIKKEIDCSVCHPNPDKSRLPNVSLKPFCMDCHGKTDPALNACPVCHKEVRQDKIPTKRAGMPIAHDAPEIWEKTHGHEYRFDSAYCALCHDNQTFCQDCHQTNKPDDHTVSWRRKPHGLRAEWNRDRCAACHDEDSCRKCHENTQPSSHRNGWARPQNRHCVNCHLPAQDTSCTVCHEEIDHHLEAKPSPHTFGVYPPACGLCHPGSVPYLAPHPMNSTVGCRFCHI